MAHTYFLFSSRFSFNSIYFVIYMLFLCALYDTFLEYVFAHLLIVLIVDLQLAVQQYERRLGSQKDRVGNAQDIHRQVSLRLLFNTIM